MVKLVKQGETGYGASPRMETDRRALQHRAELVEDPPNPARRCSTLRSVAIPATGAGSFSSVCADLHSKKVILLIFLDLHTCPFLPKKRAGMQVQKDQKKTWAVSGMNEALKMCHIGCLETARLHLLSTGLGDGGHQSR